MKKKQMEVMREARNTALEQGVTFHTINIKHPSGKKQGGNIIVAFKKVPLNDFVHTEEAKAQVADLEKEGLGIYRVQFSYCSPNEKNPSRIFGEGQAALRFFNEESAIGIIIPPSGTLSAGLRVLAIKYAAMRRVPWMVNIKLEDLV